MNCQQKPSIRVFLLLQPTKILDAITQLAARSHPVGDLSGWRIPDGNPALAIPHREAEMRGGQFLREEQISLHWLRTPLKRRYERSGK